MPIYWHAHDSADVIDQIPRNAPRPKTQHLITLHRPSGCTTPLTPHVSDSTAVFNHLLFRFIHFFISFLLFYFVSFCLSLTRVGFGFIWILQKLNNFSNINAFIHLYHVYYIFDIISVNKLINQLTGKVKLFQIIVKFNPISVIYISK